MYFTSEQRLDGGVLEREFILGEIPGILWTPGAASVSASGSASASTSAPGSAPASESVSAPASASTSAPGSASASTPAPAPAPAPLILLGHPPLGLRKMYPRLVARARHAAAQGFATATIELPGSGDRPRLPAVERARAGLRRAKEAGEPVGDEIVDALVLPLVDEAVPEWQTALDALLGLPEIGGPVGFSGGVISIGIRLAVVEPRIVAAGLFAGSLVPRVMYEEARQVTVPLHVLLQWDDEGNDRQAALDLFDAFGSREKTLVANMGGHAGVPRFAGEDAARFFARHLK
ncbi:alpha/beta hydrolase [Streptomyces albofaciens JCM 4342]|uniref:alpha/beta hydrolase n=1 Tax=Streptomyces albofaciens TaxID=66866 RepID=UPI0012388A7C|nr:alpha/beta hydrolase [Streptomyces albofaciens]KAA6214264.1 alpha/beta hydrolase [Streptomyces albofaciens JCM 4342]